MLKQNSETFIGITLVSQLLYRLLHQAPTNEFLSLLYDEQLFSDWPLELNNNTLQQGLSLLAERPNLSAINNDFAALFIGPNKLKAAPWASVYLNEEQITFGEQTLAIREFYTQFGVAIDTGEREPEDHIGLIFSFIAHLCELTAQQFDTNENTQVCPITTFLTDHVLTWAPRMLQTMKQNADTPYYQGIALVAEGTLRQLAQLVNAQYLIVTLHR
ncbi:molecular chaperone TorD family protein [Vibrio sp. FNV 38]|nr:molecular chaperone TorD family protein [Vibrio sp. FNV 38]